MRISGPRAEAIVRAVVPGLPKTLTSHKLVLGEACDPVVDPAAGGPRVGPTGASLVAPDALIDQVLVVVMRAPRSYTGEDVAEIHGHGGHAVLAALLAAVLAQGARLATAGEFTRRAFLAGKIDLSQAEAVSLLIGARDRHTLRVAQALRRGVLGKQIDEARRIIVDELAEIEGALDFPDDTIDQPESASPAERSRRLLALAAGLKSASRFTRPLGVVPEVWLVGQVNAGKSSLLNALVGYERALVHDEPGTTRDAVEVELDLDQNRLVKLVDTAGEREDASELEQRGQAIARGRREAATLALCVFDAKLGWRPADETLSDELVRAGLRVLRVANKSDLARSNASEAVEVSARTGAGLAALRERITAMLREDDDEVAPVASARQAEAVRTAAERIERAAAALTGSDSRVGTPEVAAPEVAAPEVAAIELRRALHALGQVTGETVDESVLDAIFSRFCIGK